MADEGTTTDNPDHDVQRSATPAPDPPPAEDRESEPASGSASPESADEIVLTEGKTLSDYLEDEPDATKPKPAPGTAVEYRSISNVEKMIVPPPGGLLRKPTDEEPE